MAGLHPSTSLARTSCAFMPSTGQACCCLQACRSQHRYSCASCKLTSACTLVESVCLMHAGSYQRELRLWLWCLCMCPSCFASWQGHPALKARYAGPCMLSAPTINTGRLTWLARVCCICSYHLNCFSYTYGNAKNFAGLKVEDLSFGREFRFYFCARLKTLFLGGAPIQLRRLPQ